MDQITGDSVPSSIPSLADRARIALIGIVGFQDDGILVGRLQRDDRADDGPFCAGIVSRRKRRTGRASTLAV